MHCLKAWPGVLLALVALPAWPQVTGSTASITLGSGPHKGEYAFAPTETCVIASFGERPKGMLVFTADGHFSQVHVSGDLPRIASNNRLAGTPEQNAAIVHGSLALFGTYTVDETKKTLTFNIVASTFPNQQGTSQTRTIDKLTADEFVNTNPAASRDGPAVASNRYRRAK